MICNKFRFSGDLPLLHLAHRILQELHAAPTVLGILVQALEHLAAQPAAEPAAELAAEPAAEPAARLEKLLGLSDESVEELRVPPPQPAVQPAAQPAPSSYRLC